MERDDDYIFKKNGSSEKIITDDKFDRVIADRNKELELLNNSDKFDFAEEDGDRLVYEVPKGVMRDYGSFALTKNPETFGTAFTVTDKEHADNIYRMLAGNSVVEYGKADYQENGNDIEKSRIWNSGSETSADSFPVKEVVNRGATLLSKSHSHPFKGSASDSQSIAYPSQKDISNLGEYNRFPRTKDAKHEIYSPYKVKPDSKGFTTTFDGNGGKEVYFKNDNEVIEYKRTNFQNNLRSDAEKNLPKDRNNEFKNYYLWKKK